jgi:solute carrier family 25 S-adenosylmethionine transporter 26
MQFPMFERMKEGIKRYRDERGLSKGTVVEMGWITAVSAGSAGAVSAVLTTPVDVVKTRVMLAAVEGEGGGGGGSGGGSGGQAKGGLVDALGKSAGNPKDTIKTAAKDAADTLNPLKISQAKGRKSSWAVGKEIVEEKGFKGLWRGGALRGVWTFIGAGLYLGAYESGRVWLASRRGEKVDEDDLL